MIEWRPLPGWLGVEVSSDGRVRRGTTIYRTAPNPVNGYHQFGIRFGGPARREYVHRAVLMAFVGPCPPGKEAAHLSGVRGDNRPENLVWATRSENIGHKRLHGTDQNGERNHGAKLTTAEVVEIRATYKGRGNPSYFTLAARYGVTYQHVSAIIRGNARKLE